MTYIKYFVITVIIFFFPILSDAQTTRVYGIVKDINNKTLSGADISVTGVDTHCVSNRIGEFSLSVPNGNQKVKCSLIGYSSHEEEIVCAGKDVRLVFGLDNSSVSLDEVTVVGKSSTQRLREQPNAVTVIDMSKLRGRSLSMNDVLNQASGVKVLEQGGLGSSSRVFVQGMDGKRISVFVNGMPMGNAENFQQNSIPTDMIEKVEIYKGVVPSWLGGGGIGGAINIVTRSYTTDNIEASYGYSTYATHRAELIGHKNLGRSGVSLSVNGSYEGSENNYTFDSPFQQNLSVKCDNNAYRKAMLGVGISTDRLWFDKLGLSFGYRHIYDEVQGGMMTIQNRIHSAHVKKNSFSTAQNFMKHFMDGKMKITLNSSVDYCVVNLIDTATVRYEWDGTTTKHPMPGELGNFPNNSDDKYWNVTEMIDMNHRFNDIHSLFWNATYNYSHKNPHDPLSDKYSKYSTNGFPSKMHSVVSGIAYKLNLMGGQLINELGAKILYQYSEIMPSGETAASHEITATRNEGTNWSWSEAMAWKPSKDLTLKASVAHAVRIPTTDELFGDCLMISPSITLKPEKSWNINLGIEWLLNQGAYPSLRADINMFYMKVEQMIRLLSAQSFQMAYANLDKAKIMGAELELESELLSWASVKGNISYQNARDAAKEAVGGGTNSHYNFRLPNMPYFFGNAELDLHKNNLVGRNTSSSFFANMEYTHEFSYNWAYSSDKSLYIPTKWNINIGVRHSFMRHFKVGFEVHNLFDKKQWSEFRYALPGRSLHANVKVIF